MTLTPPFISNPNNLGIDEIKEICSTQLQTRKECEYAISVFQLLLLKKRDLHIQEIFDDGVKTSCGARKRLDNFVNYGVMKKMTRKIDGVKKPVSVYCFQRTQIGFVAKTVEKEFLPKPYLSEDLGNPLAFEHDKMTFKDPAIDNLICSVLFGALEFNRLSKAQILDVVVKCYGADLSVTTRCLSGEDKVIARVTDLKTYIAVMTLCEEIISYRKKFSQSHKNNFVLDSRDINELLGRENSGGHITSVTKSLVRLSDTQFEIKNIPPKIMARYGFDQAVQNIDPVSNLGIFSNSNSLESARVKTLYTFSLPDAVYSGLMSDRHTTFRINPDVLKEKNDIIFAFHLFCRRAIGNASSRTFAGNINLLKAEIAPHLPMKDFKQKLHNGLTDCYAAYRRRVLTSESTGIQLLQPKETDGRYGQPEYIEYSAVIYGYFLRISGDSIDISVDLSDRYVGNESKHNFIKSKKEALGKRRLGAPDSDINGVSVDQIKLQFGFEL